MNILADIKQAIADKNKEKAQQLIANNLPKLSVEDKQEILVSSIIEHFTESELPFFTAIFDKLLSQKTNIDAPIDHFAPSILCLAIELVSLPLFQYLISKGANVNYVIHADHFLDDDEDIHINTTEDYPEYLTCLDYAEIKMANLINARLIEKPLHLRLDKLPKETSNEEITISKTTYQSLQIQSMQYQNIINLQLLIDYIEEIGGEMLEEMEG